MPDDNGRIFLGTGKQHKNIARLPPPPPWRDFRRGAKARKGQTYQAGEKEVELVNAALYLRRPLLVTGRPGVGKSSLAFAVAWELQLGDVLIWPINSRSTLQQGLYDYDAIARVRDASLETRTRPINSDKVSALGGTTASDIGRYIRLGPLGTAFLGGPSGRPRVLLVDELDKSDIDLPNDLLAAFEEGEFEIRELSRLTEVKSATVGTSDGAAATITNGRVQCDVFPVVIVTSNGERDFPPAFLRRCLRLDIDLPQKGELERIVEQHLSSAPEHRDAIQKLIREFLTRRDQELKLLATDQLLNAVYLVMQGIDPTARGILREALLRALGENR